MVKTGVLYAGLIAGWCRLYTTVVVCLLLLVFGAGITACSQNSRYQVLTVFFTGVPDPNAVAEEKRALASQNGDQAPAVRQRRQPEIQTPFFVHGPFGAGQCELCHATTASKPFRSGMEEISEAATATTQSIGPRLAFPLEELCVTCHSEKSAEVAKANGLWQHGPVANGWCTTCHSPHKAARQYNLLEDNNVELCTQCHSQEDLLITEEHRKEPSTNCITCHNPHVGENSYLLKAEYDEWSGMSGIK